MDQSLWDTGLNSVVVIQSRIRTWTTMRTLFLKDSLQREVLLNLKLWEILKSERSHIKHLSVLLNHYWLTLHCRKDLIASEEIYLIFNNLEILYKVSMSFLKDLESLYMSIDQVPCSIFLSKLSDTFSSHRENFKKYGNYINNYDKSLSFLSKIRKKRKEINELIIALEESDEGWDLTRRMYSPLCRIPQYPLLLKAVLESLEPGTEEYFTIKKILKKIQSLVYYIDSQKHNYTEMAKLMDIQKKIKGRMIPVLNL
eukprot:TRINITY_DN4102_c0_g1_i4.p1 TRINITY_DN4102_c0_g1~~TRINITY_DN4102_c0_g1_i4.p1  ORF type:complete len:256 (+),score=46.56 TRINITY_DN4102_c0_g1_i4:180-947(+)